MRVLHVIHGLSRGGLENGVVNLVNHLSQQEFQQAVCCLDWRGEMADRIKPSVEIFELNRQSHDFSLPFRLAGLIKKWRPDVVHCRNWNAWLDAAFANVLAGGRPTLLWSFHGFADGNAFPLRRRLASRVLATITDRMFAVCRDSAGRYAQISGIPPKLFDVIFNGVDCDRFQVVTDKTALRADLGIPLHSTLVLTVASLTPIKDHHSLVKAAARVLEQTDRPVQFLFVGDGVLRSSIEAEIDRLELGDSIRLLGNSDRVPAYLSACDLFVLPSRLEGMSNAILEAMASGLPVVANRVGGNPELVEDGVTGLLCQQGNTHDMADAIRRLVEQDSVRESMGVVARRRAEEKFSIRTMMDAYARYYRSIAPH